MVISQALYQSLHGSRGQGLLDTGGGWENLAHLLIHFTKGLPIQLTVSCERGWHSDKLIHTPAQKFLNKRNKRPLEENTVIQRLSSHIMIQYAPVCLLK